MNPSGENGTIIIDDAALLAGAMHKQKTSILSPFFWHKIFVKNAEGESRDLVLQALMDAVRPHNFIPVHYEASGDGMVSFLVKNCGKAILQLCELNLTVAHPETAKNYPPFRLTIVLKDKHSTKFKVEMLQNIVTILKRRYIQAKRTLDLEQFHLDRDLTEFCPLSQSKLLYFVLSLARDLDVAHLKLANNDIEVLKPFEVLFADKNAKNLVCIDLRKNKIQSMMEVGTLKTFPLIELNLEGNPICNEFKEHEYIKLISTLFPKLVKLDGCRINPNGMVPLRRNFVCTYSAVDLVDKFMEHYFNLYDSPDRAVLESAYHLNAAFSLTAQFLAGQKSSIKAKLVDFQKIGHNIKQISDYSKIDDTVFRGPKNIIKVLTSLPSTEHDPFTFTVDLTYFQEKVVILTVTGVFKHPGENLLEAEYLYNFMRTFVLKEGDGREYKIINEIMNVTNATSLAQLRSFKVTRVPKPTHVNVTHPRNEEERNEAVETFMVLTNMKRDWSRKCMKECSFDLKRSLNMFIDLFKGDKLPLYAFNSVATIEKPQIQKRPPAAINSKPSVETEKANKTPAEPDLNAPIVIEDDHTEDEDEDSNDDSSFNDDLFVSGNQTVSIKELLSSCDKPFAEALTIERNTPKRDAYVILNAAEKHLSTYHKDNLWYYKLVMMEYFRWGFSITARNLLNKARTYLTSDELEILNNVYLIFEIQYGTEETVDTLLKARIEAEPFTDILDLITNQAVKVGVPVVRSLLMRMIRYDISKEKRLQLIMAYHDYEVAYGSEADMKQYIDIANTIHPSFKLHSKEPYYNPIPRSVRTAAPDEGLRETPKNQAEFRRFRAAILKPLGIYNDEIDDIGVHQLVKFSGPDAAFLSMCEDVVNKHKYRFAVVKIVCNKLWQRDLHDEVTKLFEKAREFCDKQLLDNLVLLYGIKKDLLLGKETEIMAKLKPHIDTVPVVQLLNFLEDLANENDVKISKIFENLLNDPLLDSEKRRFVALEYKVFALKIHDPAIMKQADDFFRRWYVAFEAFHYEQTLKYLEHMPIPFNIPHNVCARVATSLVQRYLEEYQYSFMVGLHAIWIYFLRNFRKLARETRRLCLLQLEGNEDLHFKFSIISAILEAKYGDTPRAAHHSLLTLEKDYSSNMNYTCTLAECYMLAKDYDKVRDVLKPRILDQNVIMDPEVQKVLFIYLDKWKKTLRVDILPKILSNAAEEPRAAPPAVVSKV